MNDEFKKDFDDVEYVETESKAQVPEMELEGQTETQSYEGETLDYESESDLDASFEAGQSPPQIQTATSSSGPEMEMPSATYVAAKKPFDFKKLFVFLLIVALVSTSAYTIGYYKGQISINNVQLQSSVQDLLDDSIDSEIYNSVVSYLDDSGDDLTTAGIVNVAQIYANVSSSVVGITSKVKYNDWFNNERYTEGLGSGVLIKEEDDKYYIVTNYHVVEGATEVLVEITTDQMIDSTLVGYDSDADIAVLSIAKEDIPVELSDNIKVISIGDSSDLLAGEPAIAIGNPLGYNNTVTSGVISATERAVEGDTSTTYIQTDAAINPGNSGGALVNNSGELIGINTAKISDTTVEGMGFAIPVNTFMPIVAEIIEKGYVAKPYIGIGGVDINEEASDLYEIPVGILVRYIYDDSPAAESNMEVMDVIIAFDDQKVNTMEDLTTYLDEHEPGDQITLTVVRDNSEKIDIQITLGDKNQLN